MPHNEQTKQNHSSANQELLSRISQLEKQVEEQKAQLTEYSQFKTMMDLSEHGFALFDLDGNIIYINDYFARLHGYTPEELIQSNYSVFHDMEQTKSIEKIKEELKTQGSYSFEMKHLHKNGTEFVSQMNLLILNNSSGDQKFIAVSLTHVDEWKLQIAADARYVDFLKKLNLIDMVIRKSASAEQMMSDVLQAVLEMFEADRSWLLFPCDPDADTWSIPMERTTEQYPGAGGTGKKFPMNGEIREICRRTLQTEGAFPVGSSQNFFLRKISKQFSILSQMTIAIYPKGSKPWVLGLHQCSYERNWTTEEKDLFLEISHRISDALGTLLLIRDLSESEERFRQLANTSMEAIFFTTNGVCVEANRMASEMFGMKEPEEFIGTKSSSLFARESRETVKANLQTGFDKPFEVVGVRQDGTQFPAVVQTKSVNYKNHDSMQAISIMDISHQRETETLLRIESQKAQRYFDLANAVFVALNSDGTVSLVNKKACKVLERDEKDIIGKDWFTNFLPALHREKTRKIFNQVLKNNLKLAEYFENPVLTGSGSEKLIAWHNSVLTDNEGNLTGVLSSGQDITKFKQAEAQKLTLEKQILHAQKLESLGVLAGGIAHDFNNILMAILGNADLALMELTTANPAYSNIKAVVTAAKRAADLAKQMLAYSGKGKFLIEAINLNEAVDEMTHILEVSISRKAVIKYQYAANLPLIEADATQIRQIIMNLVTNASDAIDNTSGVISITTGAMDCDNSYLAGTYINETLSSGQYVFLEVADTGCGMTRETLKKLFDPFFTTKFTGRGLGLSAVLGIIRGHKGAIKVYSEPGRGSSIKVLFPVSTTNISLHAENGRDLIDSWKGSGTILLVDDEETILSVGKQMLNKLGFRVLLASNGREALELYSKHSQEILLVVMDLIMPHLDGEETFRELRRINNDVRVIMCSGYNEQDVTQRFAGKSLAGFLHKPYNFTELGTLLKTLLR